MKPQLPVMPMTSGSLSSSWMACDMFLRISGSKAPACAFSNKRPSTTLGTTWKPKLLGWSVSPSAGGYSYCSRTSPIFFAGAAAFAPSAAPLAFQKERPRADPKKLSIDVASKMGTPAHCRSMSRKTSESDARGVVPESSTAVMCPSLAEAASAISRRTASMSAAPSLWRCSSLCGVSLWPLSSPKASPRAPSTSPRQRSLTRDESTSSPEPDSLVSTLSSTGCTLAALPSVTYRTLSKPLKEARIIGSCSSTESATTGGSFASAASFVFFIASTISRWWRRKSGWLPVRPLILAPALA
mmetsp:Transcript_34497/g.80819  ORF Transcript_34497/g.80819 Transcript_34497/m.80819 type:complete len:299 (-) Transcript_34497:579-1475(-)